MAAVCKQFEPHPLLVFARKMADFELVESMLNAAASMEVLADNLDIISIHSTRETQFNSRESLHSSSKYDSAFDSHYSEDTASLSSQILLHTPCTVETSVLPSILTPPLPYRVATKEEGEYGPPTAIKSHSKKKYSAQRANKSHQRTSVRPSPSPSAELAHTKPSKSSTPPGHKHMKSIQPFDLSTSHQPEAEPSPPVKLDGDSDLPAKYEPKISSPLVTTTSAEILHTADVTTSEARAEYVHVSAGLVHSTLHRRLSDSSSTDDLISNDSTPTIGRRHQNTPPPPSEQEDASQNIPLTPQVTIIYPPDSNLEHARDSPNPLPRPSPFPKHGTLFYQESLTPHSSPLNTSSHRHTSPSHLLPTRYLDTSHGVQPSERKPPNRQASILQRLVRKRGSFREEGVIKRRLPVKRSFSERIAYHIRKGWIDYEEDLEFISQPSHPRAVGRMIDKKAGKYHVVQLYKPPSGKYGIFISQSTDRKGVFISRFSDNIAAKFYTGLISPGDQIIRVDGKNLAADASVDYVYDLMTKSNSVIFTVIPVCSRPDW